VAFGPDRGMFESNFPPDGVSSSYAVLWNAFKRLAARGGAVGHSGRDRRHEASAGEEVRFAQDSPLEGGGSRSWYA
jgi:L-fuconolactonase